MTSTSSCSKTMQSISRSYSLSGGDAPPSSIKIDHQQSYDDVLAEMSDMERKIEELTKQKVEHNAAISNDEGKTFFLISMGPFDDDWINQDMPPRRNSKFASTLGGLDRLSFGQVNFTDFDGFVSAQYSQYRLAFTQMRGFDKLMWLGELQLFGSLQVPVP